MLDACVLLVRVLLGILICSVGRHFIGNIGRDELANTIGIQPRDVSEQVIEAADDVGQSIQLRICRVATAICWNRVYFRILVGQLHALS